MFWRSNEDFFHNTLKRIIDAPGQLFVSFAELRWRKFYRFSTIL